MDSIHYIDSKWLDLSIVNDLILSSKKIQLSEGSKERILNCRAYLDEKMKTNKNPIYGINTGFGSLYNVKINKKNLTKLQENLMLSHACGTGDVVPREIVKLMLFLKIQKSVAVVPTVPLRFFDKEMDIALDPWSRFEFVLHIPK